MKFITKIFDQLNQILYNPVILFLDCGATFAVGSLQFIKNEYWSDRIMKKTGQAEEECSELWVFTSLCV